MLVIGRSYCVETIQEGGEGTGTCGTAELTEMTDEKELTGETIKQPF